jgi:hypothetical protein
VGRPRSTTTLPLLLVYCRLGTVSLVSHGPHARKLKLPDPEIRFSLWSGQSPISTSKKM